jgi:hypothetical protein
MAVTAQRADSGNRYASVLVRRERDVGTGIYRIFDNAAKPA